MWMYAGHGTFGTYLHRFVKKYGSKCVCGELGTTKYYLTTCLLIQSQHLVTKQGTALVPLFSKQQTCSNKNEISDQMAKRQHWPHITLYKT